MFGTVNPPATKFKRLLLSGQIFRNGPFFFSCADFCFPRKILRQGALGATIPISLGLWHPLFCLFGLARSAAEGQANHHRGTGRIIEVQATSRVRTSFC
jgi:hypothetical protein